MIDPIAVAMAAQNMTAAIPAVATGALSAAPAVGTYVLRHRIAETVFPTPGCVTVGRKLETRGGPNRPPKKRRDARRHGRIARTFEREYARAFAPSVRLELLDRMQHIQVLAGTGGGKTTLLLNMAIQDLLDGMGVLLLETGGDYSYRLEPYARAIGRPVFVFDPADPNAWKWNPLEGEPERAAERAASALIAVGSNNQQFFTNINSNMLRATVLGACAHAQATNTVATLATVRNFVNDEDFRDKCLQINQSDRAKGTQTTASATAANKSKRGSVTVDNPHLTPSAREFWGYFYNSMGMKEKNEFIAGLKGCLEAILQRENVKNALCPTGTTDERILPLKEAMEIGALIIFRMPLGDTGSKTARDLSVWVMQVFQALVYERSPDNARPLIAYLDEVHNTLGKNQEAAAEDFSHFVTTCRHHHVGCVFSYQGMEMLPHDLKVVLATNARTKIWSGGQSPADSEEIQRYVGDDVLRRERSRTTRKGEAGINPASATAPSVSTSTGEEPLERFAVDEINALPRGQWLIYSTADGQVLYPTIFQSYLPPSSESVARSAKLRRILGTREARR